MEHAIHRKTPRSAHPPIRPTVYTCHAVVESKAGCPIESRIREKSRRISPISSYTCLADRATRQKREMRLFLRSSYVFRTVCNFFFNCFERRAALGETRGGACPLSETAIVSPTVDYCTALSTTAHSPPPRPIGAPGYTLPLPILSLLSKPVFRGANHVSAFLGRHRCRHSSGRPFPSPALCMLISHSGYRIAIIVRFLTATFLSLLKKP